MAESVFDDKSVPPTRADLEAALKGATPLLDEIERSLVEQYGVVTREWKFYGKQAGWTLALATGKRRFFHLIPRTGAFTVAITLGARAVAACEGSDLPEVVLAAIRSARAYAEGWTIQLDVATGEDVTLVRHLVSLKMGNK
jgi:hypothetical protein